jgi:chorismate mutase
MSLEMLERRLDELSEEVRNYPTPIARCDEQLAALLEERAEVREALERAKRELCKWLGEGGRDAA